MDYANNLIDLAREQVGVPAEDSGERLTAVEASFALQVVKWLDARERGRGRGARLHGPKEPDIDAVKAEILRKIEAIERHRAGEGAGDAEGSPLP